MVSKRLGSSHILRNGKEILALEYQHVAQGFNHTIIESSDYILIIQKNWLDDTEKLENLSSNQSIVLSLAPEKWTITSGADVTTLPQSHFLLHSISFEQQHQIDYALTLMILHLNIGIPHLLVVTWQECLFKCN